MKKILIALFCFWSVTAQADVIIGFRGKNGAFDRKAFADFAAKRKLVGVILRADQLNIALKYIDKNIHYELYGYSLGARSVFQIIKRVKHMPNHVWTVGAYHTTNVDFRRYNVKFNNYFDVSGRGNRSPGKHIGISHDKIMRYVSDNFGE